MPQKIQLESMSCRTEETGSVEASDLYSDMDFLELDGVHAGLVRDS